MSVDMIGESVLCWGNLRGLMETPERRQAKRLRVNLPLVYQHLGKDRDFGETLAKDISVVGMRINAGSFLAPGSDLLVKLRFPEVSKVIEAIAQVVWSQRISFSDHYQAGLRFTEISPVFRKWLEEYILINEAMSA